LDDTSCPEGVDAHGERRGVDSQSALGDSVRVWRRRITAPKRLRPSALRTCAKVNVSNNSPNGTHLNIDDAVELLRSHTKLAPSRAQTTLSAIESWFARGDGQRSYFHADTLCHRPALCCRIDIL
jgi:hypothetical protein